MPMRAPCNRVIQLKKCPLAEVQQLTTLSMKN